MSLNSVEEIITRIKSAPENSKISVFRTGHPIFLDAGFSATIIFSEKVKSQKNNFIGEFWSGDDVDNVREILKSSLTIKKTR